MIGFFICRKSFGIGRFDTSMFSLPFIFFLVVLLILGLPLLFFLVLFRVVAFGFEGLGLSFGGVLVILFLMLLGSFINIPLGKRRLVQVQETRFFGLVRKSQMRGQGLSLNVGGALVPTVLAGYLLFQAPLPETLLATVLLVAICFSLARFIPGKGIAIPLLFPALFATLFALVLAFENAAPVAYISGVFGVLVGGDLLHLPRVIREGQGVMSIGGAGVFDGIFLIAIFATFLAGLL